ncbi:MAG: DUF3137 domain-containing protein [Myxococcales bacterium]|nr:DUF3137 domain-containing protein [Myxococcales bacterium]
MKTLAETRAYLQENIPGQLKELEKERMASLLILGAIALISFVLLVFGTIQWLLKSEMSLFFIGLFGGIVLIVVYQVLLKKYQLRFEKEAIPKFAKFIDPSMSMRPSEGKAQSIYQKTFSLPNLLVTQSPNKIRGQFDGLSVEISQIEFRASSRFSPPRFQGFFFLFTLSEELQTPLFLLPTQLPSHLNKSLAESLPKKTKEIKLDGKSQFSSKYTVHCEDEAIAKRFIREKAREQALSILREDVSYCFVTYQKRQLSFALPSKSNIFAPSLFSKANNIEYFEEMYKLLLRSNRLAEAMLEA